MGMPIREQAVLMRQALAAEDLVKAIRSGAGKELAKQVAAMEKAAGGKRKMDEADKALTDAQAEAARLVAKGRDDAAARVLAAQGGIDAARARMDERSTGLDERETRLNARGVQLKESSAGLDDRAETLKSAEKAVENREGETLRRASEVTVRETAATAREDAIKRHDNWAQSRPAA